MDESTKQKLRDAGREDLIELDDISRSGFAGILPNGNIVDRRIELYATPIKENTMFNVPEPKPVMYGDYYLYCGVCKCELPDGYITNLCYGCD